MIAADQAGDLDRMNDLAVQLWVNGLYRTPDQVDLAIRERVREMNKIALQNAAESTDEQALGPPAAGRLSEIKAPTLVIVGEVDVLTTHHAAKLMVEQMANAQQAVIPNTAHLPNMERPDEFNRVVLDFLRAL